MKDLIKSLQTYLWIVFSLAIICSSLLAHIGIPVIAILGGFIISVVVTRFLMKNHWNNVTEYTVLEKWSVATLSGLIGSQMGWVALLI